MLCIVWFRSNTHILKRSDTRWSPYPVTTAGPRGFRPLITVLRSQCSNSVGSRLRATTVLTIIWSVSILYDLLGKSGEWESNHWSWDCPHTLLPKAPRDTETQSWQSEALSPPDTLRLPVTQVSKTETTATELNRFRQLQHPSSAPVHEVRSLIETTNCHL